MTVATEDIKGANIPEYVPPSKKVKAHVFAQNWLFLIILFEAIFIGYHYFSEWVFQDAAFVGAADKLNFMLFVFFSLTFGPMLAWETMEWRLGNETSYYLDARGSRGFHMEMLKEDVDWILDQAERNDTDQYTELKRCIELAKRVSR